MKKTNSNREKGRVGRHKHVHQLYTHGTHVTLQSEGARVLKGKIVHQSAVCDCDGSCPFHEGQKRRQPFTDLF